MARNYTFAPNEYYHIYNRGFEKMPVFKDTADYTRFLEALYLCNSKQPVDIRTLKQARKSDGGLTFDNVFGLQRTNTLVDIGAYCLMPNHFHLLVRAIDDDGISKFMQKHTTSYTMYMNKKYDRAGALFGSSFKAVHVIDDTHLKYLFAYIHLNPKDVVEKSKIKSYPYSSYQDWVGVSRVEQSILKKGAFPDYFLGDMEKEIDEWLNLEEFDPDIAKG